MRERMRDVCRDDAGDRGREQRQGWWDCMCACVYIYIYMCVCVCVCVCVSKRARVGR